MALHRVSRPPLIFSNDQPGYPVQRFVALLDAYLTQHPSMDGFARLDFAGTLLMGRPLLWWFEYCGRHPYGSERPADPGEAAVWETGRRLYGEQRWVRFRGEFLAYFSTTPTDTNSEEYLRSLVQGPGEWGLSLYAMHWARLARDLGVDVDADWNRWWFVCGLCHALRDPLFAGFAQYPSFASLVDAAFMLQHRLQIGQ